MAAISTCCGPCAAVEFGLTVKWTRARRERSQASEAPGGDPVGGVFAPSACDGGHDVKSHSVQICENTLVLISHPLQSHVPRGPRPGLGVALKEYGVGTFQSLL